MVLPPPAAHDESGARDADWVEQIKLGLRLNRAGILIHVDQGRPEHLGKLVRALLPEHPNLDVFTDVRAVLRAEPGTVLILVPKPEDADWLNLNRPIFAQRKLAVVLYCNHPTSLALADRAVDFFDWVSQHHTCPDGPPDFAVQGFRKAVANNAPGIVWTGQNVEGLVRVFEAAFPGETLQWVLPGFGDELAERIRSTGDTWVACRTRVAPQPYDFRQALVIAGKRTRAIMMMAKPRAPAWWPVNDTCLPLETAQTSFHRAGMRHSGRLAVLTGLEKDTVELAGKLLNGGMNEMDLLATLCSEMDPGIALGKKAYGMRLADMPAVALRIASPPLLRALDDSPEVHTVRETIIKAVEYALLRNRQRTGDAFDLGEVFELGEVWSSSHAYQRMPLRNWRFLLHELTAPRTPVNNVASRVRSFPNPPDQKARISTLELPRETIASLCKGEYVDLLNVLARHRSGKRGAYRRRISQIRARIYLDLPNYGSADQILCSAIPGEGLDAGPSAPRFAELMLDLALLLHRKGDARTAFALLHKLLASEWMSQHVDAMGASEVSAKPTQSAQVNDLVHLFLTQADPPPLPPESRARALRVLAEVLLGQGRYDETEDVAQQAHETALHAHEIARPEAWRALALCGRARALQGRHVEGKQDLQCAIELATDAFGQTHAEVARLWLHLVWSQALYQTVDSAEMIRKAIDVWDHAQCEAKERAAALEELRRLSSLSLP